MTTKKCNKVLSRSYQGLAPLTKEVKGLTSPIFKKHGFASIDIISNWQSIVGQELAQGIIPEKLSFPKGERTNGTLTVKSAGGAFALLFQHKKKHILDKINTYFGYLAVKEIRIKQGKIPLKIPQSLYAKKENIRKIDKDISEKVACVQNEEIKEILENIGMLVRNNLHKG